MCSIRNTVIQTWPHIAHGSDPGVAYGLFALRFLPRESFQVVFYHTSYPDGKPVVFIGIHPSIKPIAPLRYRLSSTFPCFLKFIQLLREQ